MGTMLLCVRTEKQIFAVESLKLTFNNDNFLLATQPPSANNFLFLLFDSSYLTCLLFIQPSFSVFNFQELNFKV